VLGLFPGGVEHLPRALLDAGLADAVGARHAGLVASPPYDPARDAATGLLNPVALSPAPPASTAASLIAGSARLGLLQTGRRVGDSRPRAPGLRDGSESDALGTGAEGPRCLLEPLA